MNDKLISHCKCY